MQLKYSAGICDLWCIGLFPGDVVTRVRSQETSWEAAQIWRHLGFEYMYLFVFRQLMKQIQSHGFPPEVEEQDDGTLPMPCAQESGMDRHPAACASARINV